MNKHARKKPQKQVVVRPPMRLAGLFAGIGGFESGFASSRHRTALLCESDTAATSVLAHRFPRIPVKHDIRELRTIPKSINAICAGFPCQDLSQVGTRRGLNGSHSSLIECVFRLLSNRPVEWVILENVPFMLNLQNGAAMSFIAEALEALGYSWAYRVVDSRAFGLPQRRRRVYLVASQSSDPRDVLLADDAGAAKEPRLLNGEACGFYWTEGNRGVGWVVDGIPPLKGGSLIGIPSPPAIMLPNAAGIVVPDIRDAERLQGFPSSWTTRAKNGRRSGAARWRLVGNAVPVPVARWIGRRLRRPGVYSADPNARPLVAKSWPKAAWGIDGERFEALVSDRPVSYVQQSLESFLQYPATPLSKRAASGFFRRLSASTLTAEPKFLDALEAHIATFD